MATVQTFIIVGASFAGAKAAQTLREEGFTGRLVLIGDEVERRYQRPPLSMGYLLGMQGRPSFMSRTRAGIWRTPWSCSRVTSLDRAGRRVELEGGNRLGYRKLLLATGAPPRGWIYPVPT